MKASRFLLWLTLAAAALTLTLLLRVPLVAAWPAIVGAVIVADVARVDRLLRRAIARGRARGG
jgi:hypothetical protein